MGRHCTRNFICKLQLRRESDILKAYCGKDKKEVVFLKLERNETLLMIGDSITDFGRKRPVGEGLHEGVGIGYPMYVRAFLESMYPDLNIHVINMGTSGDNVRALKERWQTDVFDLKPDWVSVMIGVNDVWRQFDQPGIAQGIHNLDDSIASFARASFSFALDTHQDLWFATKDTISKTYDHHFKDVFQQIFEDEYKDRFAEAGITYFYTLIDDAVARVIRSEGGFIWACKNYDGDVMSDMVSTAFGSLAMMTSVLVSPAGYYEFEAAHGTVQRHYYKHLAGEETSTNSVATIFAWTGALAKRGELDDLPELVAFAKHLEKATIDTIEAGIMTGDLAAITSMPNPTRVNTRDFIAAVADRL